MNKEKILSARKHSYLECCIPSEQFEIDSLLLITFLIQASPWQENNLHLPFKLQVQGTIYDLFPTCLLMKESRNQSQTMQSMHHLFPPSSNIFLYCRSKVSMLCISLIVYLSSFPFDPSGQFWNFLFFLSMLC